ncbi:hybrid signal transduction histidine kinase G isoform X1 [Lucilia sericata]|uniref:hybrid signal transduction histidine kinase G isoform X1 n=1 Tax=Lucilia sericata TaxID=13632 RepID=UPI0018A8442C|nr:hybrid signal transduction histidine kinase G isoform X1 [Lucilia sericata]XP_037807429.1 hybrid signal transduction histidine kinase G isoform X1 [Lucilia sericata]XP_037807430.1 hybrid signal transduction histidine kinase G isoform X1 [Lucilia sericata]XP_037807431.1 hybrid signal transduction histidine kinase G isoform X1 [Lucilia sericata]XP_037807432.1 hybrid signal transduction histidine kinase G isoform X1 [Lucilia sericata]XP_037807433.1 hybrid signal transduction histidine kinase G
MTPDIITKATMTALTATATTSTITKAIYTVSSSTTTTSATKSLLSTTSSSPMRTTTISATSPSTTSIVQRHRLTIEKLRHRVHQILKCVINLHIDILVLESNVNQLLDEVKEFNADLMEVKRLDDLIETLRDYSGPTIYHEWPFPLVCQATIDEADLAQTLNTTS